jgi:hypothetical protein
VIIINHRVNTIDKLENTPKEYGVEVDLRSNGNDIIIHHDPFKKGVLFKDWLQYFNHKTLILNVKEEGLEQVVLNYLNKKNITDYFFLDQSFPFLIKYSSILKGKSAVRFSEYESSNSVLNLKKIINWVWVDYFNFFPLDYNTYVNFKNKGFKICLVSPELQGFGEDELLKLRNILIKSNIKADAVCTKNPSLWT